jgi:hypothetical protein
MVFWDGCMYGEEDIAAAVVDSIIQPCTLKV